MLPKTEEDSANVAFLCAILVTLISLITVLIVLLLPEGVDQLLNAPGISNYLLYVPAITFFNGIFFVQNYWLSRKVRFGVIAGSRIVNTVSTKAFQLAAPLMSNISPFGLIAGYVAGYGCADLFMLKGVKNDLKIFSKVTLKRMKEMAIEYKNFPLYSSWSTLANTISPQVPTFLLAYYYSTSVVGYFSLANQVVNMPMGLLGQLYSRFFSRK